jgi:subfamily B ATP-binding cassette protein MsbA
LLDKVRTKAAEANEVRSGSHLDASPWEVLIRLARERRREYAGRYALAFVLMAIVAGATAMSAWIMKDVVNDIFVRRDQAAIVWLPFVIGLIFLIKGTATYLQEIWLSRIGNRLVADYQRKIYDHLLQMDIGFFQKHKSNDLIMRTTRAASAARGLLNLVILSVGRDALTLLALVVVMVSQDPLLTAIILVAGPLVALVIRKMGQITKKGAKVQAATTAITIGVIRETSQGARIVKSFQLEDMLRGRMSAAIKTLEDTANRVAQVRASVNPLIEMLGGLSVAGVVAYAAWQTTSGVETPGHIFAFITALLLAADPARRLAKFHLQMKALAVNVGLMFEILDTPIAESKEATGSALRVQTGEVRFDRVSFAYAPGNNVLRDISFTAEGGEMTALVGPSGGGKTTVFSLLQGFWKPDSGHIFIDGQSINASTLASWRRNIALVSQDVFLFEGTIRDNIVAARPGASDDELRAAAGAACADEFIQKLPSGYDTSVGELGSMLSGGQRQRISIARAFLKNAPILLLDEPTSALDSEAEQKIQEALGELMQGRTTIVIAHRFATVQRAQRIHVIDGGLIVESGTHEELIRNGDCYDRLYELQFRDHKESPVSTRGILSRVT